MMASNNMIPEDFCKIQNELGLTHAQTAAELGLSEASVKRMAAGTQTITEQSGKIMTALLLIEREGLRKKYRRLALKYLPESDD